MSEWITMTLDNPLTDEQWNMIADVDFDNTEEVTFHTKSGKDVVFVKRDASDVRPVKEAEADGRLLVLPCKVGGTVFYNDTYGNVYEAIVQSIVIDKRRTIFITSGIGFDEIMVGKTVFLTREEAEAALRGGADGRC